MPLLLEPDAEFLTLNYDALSPENQAKAKEWLGNYKQQQYDKGEPLFPTQEKASIEKKLKLRGMFEAPEKIDYDPGPMSANPAMDRMQYANMALLSQRYQKEPREVSERYDLLMNDYTRQNFGVGETVDTAKFYALAQKEFQRMKQVEDTSLEGAKAALRGEDVIKSLQAWQAKNLDRIPDSTEFTKGYLNASEAVGDFVPMAKELLGELEAGFFKTKEGKRPRQENPDKLRDLTLELAQMKGRDRKQVYAALGAQIEAAGYDQKGFWAQTLGFLGKNVASMGQRLNRQALGVAITAATTPPASINDEFGFGPSSEEEFPQLAEEGRLAVELNDKLAEVEKDIARIVSGDLDPVKATTGWMNETFEKGLIKAPGATLPSMTIIGTLGPFAGGAVIAADFAESNRTELIAQGFDPQDAKRIGAIAAPMQAAVESLSNMFQLGRFPAVTAALSRFTRPVGGASLIGRYAQNTLIAGGTETAEELIQDQFIVPIVTAIDQDTQIGFGKIWENIKTQTPELLSVTLPMALVFGGKMTAADAKLSGVMTQDIDGLKSLGYSEAQAITVVSEKTELDRIKKASSLWDSRAGDKVTIETGAKNLAERMRQLSGDVMAQQQELERRGKLPILRPMVDGKWLMTIPSDGSAATFNTHQEADAARWTWAEDQLGKVHALTRETLASMEKNLNLGREVAVEFFPDVRTAQDAVNEGASVEQIKNRVEQGKALGDISPDTSFEDAQAIDKATTEADGFLSSLRILGSSKNEFKDGILRTTIKLWEGSNILTLVEEKLEGDAKAIIMEPKGREWMLSRLRSYEQASGDKLFRELPDDELKNEDIVEAWSHLGQSYLVGRSTFGEPLQKKAMRRFGRLLMRSGLTGAMNAESSFFAAVASRAQKLGELKQAGKLGDDLVSELEKQLGIDSQVSHNAVAEEMGTEIVQKGIDTSGYSPETPGPNGETFSMSRAVPADASKIVQMPDGAQLVGPTTFSIRAFHATPHKVDKFTTAKIGTGEGAQAYGWGLYFAESEAVSGRGGVYDRQFEAKTGKPSNIYTVELLPDESEFLDWDKPLSEQSEKVKAAIEPLISQFITNNENFINSELKAQAANGTMPGSKAYLLLGGEMSLAGDRSYPPALASRNLSDAGIPGVRYADQQSRVSPLEIRARQQEVNARKADVERDPSDTNKAQLVSAENAFADLLKKDREGTRNYVIFDENLVSILEENGKPVEGETFSLVVGNNLVTVHNLSENNLRHAIKVGGLAVPSLGVVRTDISNFDAFGEITLVARPDLIDPQRNAASKVFNADVYSPRYPTVKTVFKRSELDKVGPLFKGYYDELSSVLKKGWSWSVGNLVETLADEGFDRLQSNYLAQYAYLRSAGLIEAPKSEVSDFEFGESLRKQTNELRTEIVNFVHSTVDEAGIEYDEKIPMGYTNAGKRKFLPHDLDTVVKIMTRKLKDGEGFNYGVPSIRAANAKPFKSIKAIQDSRDKIVTSEEMEVLKKEVNEEFLRLAESALSARKTKPSFGGLDAVSDDMKALVQGDRSWIREMYGDSPVVDEMRTFVAKLRDMPTEYFEAKIRRAVQLQEFEAAIVPSGTDEDLKAALKKRGVAVREYDASDKSSRRAAIESASSEFGTTFSIRSVSPAQDAEYMQAVEAGDMAKAQAMVDKAAIYDNTPRKNIDRGISNGVIEPELRSLFDSYIKAARKVARRYTESGKAQRTSTPQQTGAVNRAYRLLSEKYSELHPGDYLREGLADQERAFNSISDPVTYDNAGNVIPLSKRFNPADNRITYSIRPGDFSARMEAKFSLFQAKPELRLAIAQVAKERALRLGAEWIAKGDVIRSAKNISKEQAFREADGFDRRMNAYLDSLSENARQTLEFEPSALEDDPLVSAMLDFGKLMSFTTAKKSGKVEANSGDYDGQPWLPPAWYSKGAGIMPDQMAQAMFDAGLLPDAYTGTLWSEIGKRIESTRKDKAAHREAVQAYKDAQKAAKADAKAEAEAWANQARKTAGSPKAQRDMLKGALRTLDGILAAAPPEVRARVGGYVKLAGLATDEAMLQEIERRIDKLNVELEKYLKKEAVAEIKKLFKKARPDMEAGKKGKGKDPDMHALFADAEAAAKMDALAVAGRLADLDARIASGELTPEQEVLAITERGVVELVGDLKAADSGRAFSALDTLRDIYQGAWLKWKLAEIERKERRAGMRQDFIDDTGKTGVRTERTKADKVNESLFGKGKAWLLNLSSMHEVLAYAFGLDNSRVASLVDAERAASNTYEDTNQRLGDEIEELFTSLAGTRTKGERLRWNLSQRTIKTGKGELSQLEAIQALLMWRQEDGRRHMEGTRNENNEVTSKWSYDQAWIDEIEAALTSEARQVMSFIMGKYSAEWATLNPLYRARYGVNMPHHDAYAPITVTPVQTKAGDVVDPVTGSAVSGGSILTPGSLRTRSRNAIAEPDFRDALQTMILHSRQMEYWKAYYDLAVEMNAVLGNREVMNSVYAKGGKEAANALRQWIDAIGQGGFRDASLRLALFQAGSKMQGRAAGVALLGRMSAILSQSTQLAAAAVKIPVTSYLVRLAKLMTGGLGWRDAMRSEFIQRRFKSAPPIVRQAMDSLAAAKPNEIQGLSRFFGNVLSGADAFFTSGTYAILLDYHREQGAAAGLTGAELETYAHTEAERATEQVAQPTRMANRSLAELANTGPLGKIGWAFASEARQKVALAAHAALNAKNDPVTAAKAAFLTFAVGGLFTQVLKNLLREAKGDDDREMWSLGRLGYAMTVAPIASAIPFGSAIAGDSNMLSNVQRAAQTLGNEEVDFRDVDAILSAAGLFNDNAASLAPLSHLGLDLGKILTNAAD